MRTRENLIRNRCRLLAVFVVAGLVLLGGASSASAATHSNAAPIAINDEANATPYPSTITVSGENFIDDINVTLFDVGHTFPDDIGVVLVSPGGAALQLMSAAGGFNDITAVDLLFNDQTPGGTELPDNGTIVTGDYVPTSYNATRSFPAPGPLTTYGNPGPVAAGTDTLASIFNGDNANGTWKLFVRDFNEEDDGTVAGGWSLTITSSGSAPPGEPTLTGTSPSSPANDNNPKIIGSAPGATTVTLYQTANCTGPVEATGTPAELAAGLTASVADNSSNQFSATSTSVNGASICSAPISYTESTPGPVTPVTPLPPAATQPATTKKKKCKKGKKKSAAAAKKCKRKKK